MAIDCQRESCLIALALHVTITDDDSHSVSESQTLPADESVEYAGMCHCFPQRVSVVRALSAQRQHREVVSNQWHAQCSKLTCINVHRSMETNKCARCGVHAKQFRNVRAFLSAPRIYTQRDARCALTLTSAHGCRGQHERDWIALTHFPPPGATRLAYKRRRRLDKRQTQVAKR